MKKRCWERIFSRYQRNILLIGINQLGFITLWSELAMTLTGVFYWFHVSCSILPCLINALLGYAISFAMDKPLDQILCTKHLSLGYYLSQCLQDNDFANIHLSYTSYTGTTHDLCCSFRVRKDWRMQIIGAVCEAYDISTIPSPIKQSSTFPSNDSLTMVKNLGKCCFLLTSWCSLLSLRGACYLLMCLNHLQNQHPHQDPAVMQSTYLLSIAIWKPSFGMMGWPS